MHRMRRQIDEPRVELMPLIDVIFLLLTFFVFAMAIMVRADLLDVQLPDVTSGTPAMPGAIVTVAIDSEDIVYVDGEETSITAIVEAVRERRDQAIAQTTADTTTDQPAVRILIAADEDARSGTVIRVIDALRFAGVGDLSVMGRPGAAPATSPVDDQ